VSRRPRRVARTSRADDEAPAHRDGAPPSTEAAASAAGPFTRQALHAAILRLVVAALVLTPVGALFALPVVRACLPAYRAAFEIVAPDFRVTDLRITTAGGHRGVAITVGLHSPVFVGTQLVFPDPRGSASASTPLSHALQAPLVACLVSFAWFTGGWIRRLAATALALLLTLPFVAFDAPVVLAATLWHTVVDGYAPGTDSHLFPWSAFLLGGGRWLIGGLAGLAAIGAVRAMPFGSRRSRDDHLHRAR
jgi:hypothetical protein